MPFVNVVRTPEAAAPAGNYAFLGDDFIATDTGAPPSIFGPLGPFNSGGAVAGKLIWIAAGTCANARTFVAVRVHVPSVAGDATGTVVPVVTGSLMVTAPNPNGQAQWCVITDTWNGAFEITVEVNHIENACGVAVYSTTGVSSTPLDVDKIQLVFPSSQLTLTTSVGGFVLAYVFSFNNGNNPTHIWTNINERFDTPIETSTAHTAADVTTSGTSLTITCALSGLNLYNAFTAISF